MKISLGRAFCSEFLGLLETLTAGVAADFVSAAMIPMVEFSVAEGGAC